MVVAVESGQNWLVTVAISFLRQTQDDGHFFSFSLSCGLLVKLSLSVSLSLMSNPLASVKWP